MKTIIHAVDELLKEGLPIIRSYVDNAIVDKVVEDVEKKLIDATPIVMVYGVYNAGKSTLLNAMLGEEKATMADKPETSKVTAYQWRGFTVLDTPGIDAPIAHEKIAREQLERSDVVLFVLSNDGTFEEQKIYDEMCNILAMRKPLIVIVNNKAGQNEASGDYLRLRDVVLDNLKQTAKKRTDLSEAESQVKVLLINAKTALKGRLENKEKLVEHSKLPELMNTIEEQLKGCNANTIAVELGQRITKTLISSALEQMNAREKSLESQVLSKLQDTVKHEKLRTRSEITFAIRSVIDQFRKSYWSAAEMGDETRAKTAFDNAISSMTHSLKKEIGIAQDNLKALALKLEGVMANINNNAAMPSLTVSNTPTTSDSTNSSLLVEDLTHLLISNLTKEGAEQVTKTAVLSTLQFTKEWLPSVMKGIGAKGMDKIAENAGQLIGRAVPFVGPAISIITGIFGYYRAEQAQKEQQQQIERQIRALRDAVDQQAQKLEREFETACDTALNEAFSPIELKLEEDSRVLDDKSQKLNADRSILNSIQTRLSICIG